MAKRAIKRKATKGPSNLADYLKRPYGRVVTPETDGSYRAEIIEFPGCITLGESGPEALCKLETTAIHWLEAAIKQGQRVPDPIETGTGFSGKLVLRLPKSLHKRAAHFAARDGVSLNQFIVTCVAENVGANSSWGGITLHFQPGIKSTVTQTLLRVSYQQSEMLSVLSTGALSTGPLVPAQPVLQITGLPAQLTGAANAGS